MSRRQAGVSLIEVTLAALLIGMMLTTLFGIYTMGARTWAKAETQVDLLQTLQVVLARVVRDGQSSSQSALTVDPQGLAMPCARDANARELLDISVDRMLWQRYCVYYYDAAAQMVEYREVVLSSPTTSVVPVTEYDDGSGPHPMTYYEHGGQSLAGHITSFQPAYTLGLVTLKLQGQQLRAGSQAPETVALQASVRPRNP